MKKIYILFLVCSAVLAGYGDNCPRDSLLQIGPGEIVLCTLFTDKIGKHSLFLTRNYVRSPDDQEKITLRAIQFCQKNSTWNQEWVINDFIECEILDIEGEFFTELTALTDLDNDSVIETTVTYQMICAGDVEPKIIKTIMRQGTTKYAVRGESLVHLSDTQTVGGNYNPDKELPKKTKFLDFMVNIWKTAAGYEVPRKRDYYTW
jgi:hypothetical protein